eukprot:m.174888 g.174888  ORF g.174888 m.174888 type:complete len:843 (+) comp15413_c0_seq8:237-2765(+)
MFLQDLEELRFLLDSGLLNFGISVTSAWLGYKILSAVFLTPTNTKDVNQTRGYRARLIRNPTYTLQEIFGGVVDSQILSLFQRHSPTLQLLVPEEAEKKINLLQAQNAIYETLEKSKNCLPRDIQGGKQDTIATLQKFHKDWRDSLQGTGLVDVSNAFVFTRHKDYLLLSKLIYPKDSEISTWDRVKESLSSSNKSITVALDSDRGRETLIKRIENKSVQRVLAKTHNTADALIAEHCIKVLNVAINCVLSVNEYALDSTRMIIEAQQYWEKEKSIFDGNIARFGILAKFSSSFWHSRYLQILEHIKELRAQEQNVLVFIGRIKYLMSSFEDDSTVAKIKEARDEGCISPSLRQSAILAYRRRLQRVLVYSASFISSSSKETQIPQLPAELSNSDILTTAQSVLDLFKDKKRSTPSDAHAPPGYLEGHPIQATIGIIGIALGSYCLYTSSPFAGSDTLEFILLGGIHSFEKFIDSHMVEPVTKISEYINEREKRSLEDMADLEELENTKRIIQTMLKDFVSEQPYTSESERERMFELAAQCDMRATDNTFLEEVKTPLLHAVRGNIIRLMLINAMRMKMDALQAITKMNEVLHQNRTTIELAAMVPLVVLGWLIFTSVEALFVSSRKIRIQRHKLRMLMRNIETTLIKLAIPDQNENHSTMVHEVAVCLNNDMFIDKSIDDNQSVPSSPARTSSQQKNSDSNEGSHNWSGGSTFLSLSGKVVFSIERHLREFPDLLSHTDNRGELVAGTAFMGFLGAIIGVVLGKKDVKSASVGAAVLAPISYMIVLRKQAHNHLFDFDTERFLEDVHELPSSNLSPDQKRNWLNYLWRFYNLEVFLSPSLD